MPKRETMVIRPERLQDHEVSRVREILDTLEATYRATHEREAASVKPITGHEIIIAVMRRALAMEEYFDHLSRTEHLPALIRPLKPVLQNWIVLLPLMQQTVLISAIRGCDGIAKFHRIKPLVRWYRRCVLISAFEGVNFDDPFSRGGGSFTGPVEVLEDGTIFESEKVKFQWELDTMNQVLDDFVDSRDELPQHYYEHFMHGAQVLGYKHPMIKHRVFWLAVYHRIVKAKHLMPEPEDVMDKRLGDNLADWKAAGDPSASCSD